MRIIRGKYGRRRFDVPTNITARPTTDFARENIFNVIENLIDLEGIDALDLFAGTGAITFELLSRGARTVTAVEKAPVQNSFIGRTAKTLNVNNLRQVKGDVFRYISTSPAQFDFVFADPPYNMENFADIPSLILDSKLLKPGAIFIIEHNKNHDFSHLPGFLQRRVYGSVNFSIFQKPTD